MNYEIAHHTQKHNKRYTIPSNLHEIVQSTLPRDLDVTSLVKMETSKRIMNDEMNDFNFYNIPFAERIDTEKLYRTGYADFKSMHKLQAFNEKRGILTTSKFYSKKKLSDFEKNIRNELKSSNKQLFLLREIYENFDNLKTEGYQKPQTPPSSHYSHTFQNEEFDKQVIQELETWERQKTAPLKNKEQPHKSSKDMKPMVKKGGHLMKESLPTLAPFHPKHSVFPMKESLAAFANLNQQPPRQSVLTEDPKMREKLMKDAKKEQFKDETLGKALINYIKAYESAEVIKNRLKQKKHSMKSQEKTEEKLGLSVAELNKQIKLMFITKIEGTLIERSKISKQMTSTIMLKIIKKIKDSEAFLGSRSLTMGTIRKENGYILEKLKSIKELVISIREQMTRNKRGKTLASPNDSQDAISNRSSISKQTRKKFFEVSTSNIGTNNNLLTPEKTNVQNFMEKAMEEQMKEEEINQLNENRVNFEKKLKFNNDILANMEIENQTERKNLKETEKILRNFLFRLLLEGKDCRNNGLAWIILELWKLGESIYVQHLPKFLDTKAKDFLLNKAKKEQELAEISTVFQAFLENVQGVFKRETPVIENIEPDVSRKINNTLNEAEINLKENLFNKSYYQEPSIIDRDCADSLIKDSQALNEIFYSRKSINDQVYEQAKKKLRLEVSPKKNVKFEEVPKKELKIQALPTKKETPQQDYSIIYIENDKKINEYKSKEQFFKESETLEKRIREKQQQIAKMEKNEIVRIIKEFDYQEYGFKYSTDCESVLSSLIGARKAFIELIRYGMLKKN